MPAAPKTRGSETLLNGLGRPRGPSGAPAEGDTDAAGPLWRENGPIIVSERGAPDRRYVTTHVFMPLLEVAALHG